MAQVEDMPLGGAATGDHVEGTLLDHVPWGEQHGRVQVALQRLPWLDPAGRLIERNPPVHADHVGARLAEQPEQLAGADAEMYPRHAGWLERGEDPAGVRQNRVPVIVRAHRADPGVEQLYRGDAGFDLDLQERDRQVGKPAEQRVPQLRVAVHQRLDLVVTLRRAALDQV